MNTYFTDVGIPTTAVAVIVLIVKVWDAVNDPIFGGIVDKVRWKKGKFVPWLRIAVFVILAANIFLFAIPVNLSTGVKIAWAIVAYCAWSVGYTMNDVPIFGLITTITSNPDERVSLNASGRVAALVASMLVMVVIPIFRTALGGWTVTVAALSILGAVLMLPIGFTARERVAASAQTNDTNFSMKEMLQYVFHKSDCHDSYDCDWYVCTIAFKRER